MMAKRILVTGSRDWTDRAAIHAALWTAWADLGGNEASIALMHGACPTGADAIAEELWQTYAPTQPIIRFHPDWSRGRRAGPERNYRMVSHGADLCLAFPLGESRGTRGCLKMAERAGIEVRVYGG